MAQSGSLVIYTVSFLHFQDRYLFLQRSMSKTFAPGRWTGLGGHVDANEFSDLRSSALREVQEEAGIAPADIQNFSLRRVLLSKRPGSSLAITLYFTGLLKQSVLPSCPEGQLFWLVPDQFGEVDIIETTRDALPYLMDDMEGDPRGANPVVIGLGIYDERAMYQKILWEK